MAEVISNSDHISLNTDTPTRVPNTVFQQTSSPDITTVSNTLYNRTSRQTHHALSSDHLPIMTTINIRHNFRLQTYRRTFTNYKKANWTQFTKDTELAFSQTTIPDDIHTANRIFTDIILLAYTITTRTSNTAEHPVPVSSPSATNTQITLNATIVTPTATALPTQTQQMDRVVPNSDTTRTIRTAHTANTTSIHKPSSNNERNRIILQVNINSINNKLEELKTLIKNTNADIITIQETKLTSKSNTSKVPTYTTVRAHRPHKLEGVLITLIRQHNIHSNRHSFDHKYT